MAATVATVGLAVLCAVALARVQFPSTVTIRFDDGGKVETLRGKVRSAEYACVARRKVLIFGDDAATKEKAYFLLGTDRANRRGRWFVVSKDGGRIPPGRYYARVKAKEVAGGVCQPDRSPVIAVNTGAL